MSSKRLRAAVVGASGYAGSELVRLLLDHPSVEPSIVTSGRSAGKRLTDECPWLYTDLVLSPFEPTSLEVDVVFLAQESGFAMDHAPGLAKRCKVVDLSADFRLSDLDVYRSTYKIEHRAPGTTASYGLPELVARDGIAGASLVANPGCYPTATLLALMPLVRAGVIGGVPIVDAKSGVSGAGRSRQETDYLFTEITGGFKAYAAVGHRHTPEIEQMTGAPVRFTPHLLPTARGLQATVHVPVKTSLAELKTIFQEAYAGERFIRIVEQPPSTKQVVGSNRCDIYVGFDERTQMSLVISVIDNLVKGAAGQAIQNMNIMLGLDEDAGLPLHGVWP